MPDTEKPTNTGTTETRILITEDAKGNFLVEHQMLIKGTETVVPYRTSHLVGQMFVALIIVLFKGYERIFARGEKPEDKK